MSKKNVNLHFVNPNAAVSEKINKNTFVRQELVKILIAIVILMAAGLTYYFYIRHWTLHIAERRAEDTLEQTEQYILTRLGKTETVVKSMQFLAEHSLDQPDKMYHIAQFMLNSSHAIFGADMAFIEYYYPEKGRLYEPWVGYEPGHKTLSRKQIGSEEHDYTKMDWFIDGLTSEDGCWSDPYYEKDVTRTSMMTYARAIHDNTGRCVGVISADVSLDTLASIVSKIHLYPHSFCILTTEEGDTIVPPPYKITGKHHIYSNAIEGKNMILTMIIPDKDMYSRLRKSSLVFAALALLGMLAIIFIAYRSIQNLWKLNEARSKEQQIENELTIARNIQKSLLPDQSASKQTKNVDISGMQLPAKYVGGDLYDYYIRDNKLIFCIGDISGKGIPAALLMAIAHSLFRTLSAHSDSPERIMQALNTSICDNNPDIMFLTAFLGILDLTTGEVCYCNAGHNPPMLIHKNHADFLDTKPCLLLGIDTDAEYTTETLQLMDGDSLFLYTDGLTEAENMQKQLLGDQQVLKLASTFSDSTTEEQIRQMHELVLQFADKAEQSDDLTMLSIRYLGTRHSLTLTNNIQELDKLEPFLDQALDGTDIELSLMSQLDLALEEAIANIIMYAYPKGETGTVKLNIEAKDGVIHAEIIDSGIPFNPLQQQEAKLDVSLEERQIGGLGIHLIKEIMDTATYEYKDHQNILSLSKDIKKQAI